MESVNSMKRRIKKSGSLRLLKCFRPVDVVDESGCCPGSTDVAVDGKDGETPPSVPAGPEDSRAGLMGKKGRQSFSNVMKAVFFNTSLRKKIRRRKHSRDSDGSDGNFSTRSDGQYVRFSSNKGCKEDIFCRSTTTSSSESSNLTSLSSSSSSSTVSSFSRSRSFCSRSISDRLNNSPSSDELKRKATDSALALLFVTLLVVILWGKVCAIFCTSTWLYFAAWRSTIESPLAASADCDEMDSSEYKKRIVLGGSYIGSDLRSHSVL